MKTLINFKVALFFLLSLAFFSTSTAQNLESEIDEVVTSMYSPDDTGVSILIAKKGKTIYQKAFGKANLELDVSMTTDNVFELASITKQFTAVSILMLEEQGKLNITDNITTYIPDYPTKGKTITIHHLLNHTSGIKSYTDMADFMGNARTDMTVDELTDVFKNEPMDFDPGEKFHYNNSGYILLGKIIEVVSGQSYEDFVELNIFKKLGMTSSQYGSKKELIKNRARGYQTQGNGYKNADYLSMSLPYAAGSLMSSTGDMLKWQNAIANNTLIKQSSLDKAINGSKLNNGDAIDYGYGWSKVDLKGSKGYTHSGGIFGYSTNGLYLTDEDVYVIVLSNCSCKNVGEVMMKSAAIVIGKAFPNYKKAISLSEDKLKQWIGAYEFEDGAIRHVSLKEGVLLSAREDSDASEPFKIHPMTETMFVFEDGLYTYDFSMKDGNRHAIFKSPESTSIGKGINKAPPTAKVSIMLAAETLKTYVGTYELAPTFKIVIRSEGQQLFAQATGQPEFELFAEAEDKFFLKVVPASVDFTKDSKGQVTSLTLHQGGQDMPGKKVE